MEPAAGSPPPPNASAGVAFGLAAYGLWGLLPIYFKLLTSVPPVAIVAQRICWSILFLVLLTLAMRSGGAIRAVLHDRRTVRLLCVTALLIGTNWLIYVYAVNSGHILAASLGYYLNPLANILLGYFVLREPLTRLQWLAVAIAAAGVAVLAAGALQHLWISVALCISFALYGLLRKVAAVEAAAGLAIETTLLLPLALGWLVVAGRSGTAVWGNGSTGVLLLLVGTGVVSTLPLLFFTAAARRLRYSTLGILQFVAPTLQFLLAVFAYGEPFTRSHAIAFAAIWTAAALYLISSLRSARAAHCEALPD
ncbi:MULTISPECIES: EamA family transporter RarD [Sphingomonas]|uniref:EamA family transporter RarD n=1 Tax=Sphingomonas TaxID=13687 RepID=UPI000DF01B51|nr:MULTISPECIES: EamA family transporter RarD [Sphingomonas]